MCPWENGHIQAMGTDAAGPCAVRPTSTRA
ncbi:MULTISPECIES: hypothetical protein [unclassified Streptomyces]